MIYLKLDRGKSAIKCEWMRRRRYSRFEASYCRFVFLDPARYCIALTVVRQRRSHFSLLNVEEAHRAHEFRRHRMQLGRAFAVYRMCRVQGPAVRRNLFLQNHPAHHQHHPAKAKRRRDKKKNQMFYRVWGVTTKRRCVAHIAHVQHA